MRMWGQVTRAVVVVVVFFAVCVTSSCVGGGLLFTAPLSTCVLLTQMLCALHSSAIESPPLSSLCPVSGMHKCWGTAETCGGETCQAKGSLRGRAAMHDMPEGVCPRLT